MGLNTVIIKEAIATLTGPKLTKVLCPVKFVVNGVLVLEI
jgi:hypothetical protein